MEPIIFEPSAGWGAEPPPGACATRYPLVLLHGLGYRDDMRLLASWGRIPDRLGKAGATVFLGGLDAWNSHESSARQLQVRVEQILSETGAAKVNLLAHSKGGIEARCMISGLGMGEKVASLTTVCTPHRGTCVADLALKLLPGEASPPFWALDFFASCLGDPRPDSGAAVRELSRGYMADFNARTPDCPGVYYQSFGTLMHDALDDPFFALTYPLIRKYESANDGMVSAVSCRWGNFRGIIAGKEPGRGISHLEMVDFRRRAISGVDIPGVYSAIVAELKEMGF